MVGFKKKVEMGLQFNSTSAFWNVAEVFDMQMLILLLHVAAACLKRNFWFEGK